MAFQYGGDTFEGPYVAADGAPLQPAVFLSPYPHFMPFNGGAAPAKELSRTVRAKLYKTQLCRHVAAHGWCTHGDWCHFAHSSLELRPPPRPEAAYERAPDHGYDADAEGPWRDARFPPAVCGERLKVQDGRYKTMLCRHFGARGECPVGEMCHFAHGTEELRYSEGTNSARSPLRNGVLPRGFAVSPYVPFDVPCLLPRRPRAPQSGGVGGAALYKTQLCRYTAQQSTQLCPHAESCFYAHSAQELRQLPPRRQPHEAPAAAAGAARDAWAAAVAAASSDAGRLRALRDALTNAAGSLKLGPSCPPPPDAPHPTDEARPLEAVFDALTMDAWTSAFAAAGRLCDGGSPTGGAADGAAGSLVRNGSLVQAPVQEVQARYLIVEIECLYALELCASAQRGKDGAAMAAAHLASAFAILSAVVGGTAAWPCDDDGHSLEALARLLNRVADSQASWTAARDEIVLRWRVAHFAAPAAELAAAIADASELAFS